MNNTSIKQMDITTDEYRENARKIIIFAEEKLSTTDPSAPELRRLYAERQLRKSFREHLCSRPDIETNRYDMISDEMFDEYIGDYRDIGYFSAAVVGAQILHKPLVIPSRYLGDPELYRGLSNWVKEGQLGKDTVVELLRGYSEDSSILSSGNESDGNYYKSSASKKSNGRIVSTNSFTKNLEREGVSPIGENGMSIGEEKNDISLVSTGDTTHVVRVGLPSDPSQVSGIEVTPDLLAGKNGHSRKGMNRTHETDEQPVEGGPEWSSFDGSTDPSKPLKSPNTEYVQRDRVSVPVPMTSIKEGAHNKDISGKIGNFASHGTMHGLELGRINQSDMKDENFSPTAKSKTKTISMSNLKPKVEIDIFHNGATKESVRDTTGNFPCERAESKYPDGQSLTDSSVSVSPKSVGRSVVDHPKDLVLYTGRSSETSSAEKSIPTSSSQDSRSIALVSISTISTEQTSDLKDSPDQETAVGKLDHKLHSIQHSQSVNSLMVSSQNAGVYQNQDIFVGNTTLPTQNHQNLMFGPAFPPDPMFFQTNFNSNGNSLGMNTFVPFFPLPPGPANLQFGLFQTGPQAFLHQRAALSNTSPQSLGRKRKSSTLHEFPSGYSTNVMASLLRSQTIEHKGHEGVKKQRKLPKALKKMNDIARKYDLDK